MEAVFDRANQIGQSRLFEVPLQSLPGRNKDFADCRLYTMAYRTVLIGLFGGQNERFCVFNSPENLGQIDARRRTAQTRAESNAFTGFHQFSLLQRQKKTPNNDWIRIYARGE
jgi:hypothetical protein